MGPAQVSNATVVRDPAASFRYLAMIVTDWQPVDKRIQREAREFSAG
jgi:hypothetical protein